MQRTEGWFPKQGLKIHVVHHPGGHRRVSEVRLTGNARQFAKQTRLCSCKTHWFCIARHHIFVNSNVTFWLATLQPPSGGS